MDRDRANFEADALKAVNPATQAALSARTLLQSKSTSLSRFRDNSRITEELSLPVSGDFSIVSNRRYSHIPRIKIGNHNIKYCTHIKYLVIFIDKNLSWTKHLDSITNKVSKIANKTNRISRVTWGLSPVVKKELHKKVIEKIITYGFEIWYKDNARQNSKLNTLQRIGLLNITKYYRTTSSDALSVLAGIPPLYITLKHLLRAYHLKSLKKYLHPPQRTIKFLELEDKPEFLPSWENFTINWTHYNQETNGINIFTDGSKMEQKKGSPFAVYQDGKEISHPPK
ncbi:uncharacterized protein CDAR_613771 [Caerostris darwini]|uniref:Uncharacterized protein n=1 Tax=Caerostris darwini TaxID=1538125 RepID=A0AAV4TVG7_9ARAC|nr:uncharacterized protein CDAR_613771 [Caerostris darwini]